MNKHIESNRKAQRNFSDRMHEKGYQRATVWIPHPLLEILRKKAVKEGTSLQDVIVRSLKQTAQQIEG